MFLEILLLAYALWFGMEFDNTLILFSACIPTKGYTNLLISPELREIFQNVSLDTVTPGELW